jgi:hypothetical protein
MRLTLWLLAAALVVWIMYAAITGTPAAADETPTTTTGETTTVEVDRQLQGKNVDQWHAVATRYLQRSRNLRRKIRVVIHSPLLPGHWLERSFACIHDGEGSWSAATGNGYYGGLQMDLSFQRTYGDWALRAFGTANNWPASVQVATAIRAYTSGRGFHPWPNTARACGLIR